MALHTVVGLLALAFGALGAVGHLLRLLGRGPRLLGKLEPMRARWGRVPGTALHIAAYVLAPLVLGALLLLSDG